MKICTRTRTIRKWAALAVVLMALSFAAGLLTATVTAEAAGLGDWEISDAPKAPAWDAAVESVDLDALGGELVQDSPQSPYAAISMTEQESRELELILAMEAQTEGLRGEMAVVEVIFNRVLSPNWPDSIHGVLSQKGQFSTWKYLSKPYNLPGEMESDAIADVLTSPATVLPDRRYVFFDTKGRNGREKIRIGNHVFGRES